MFLILVFLIIICSAVQHSSCRPGQTQNPSYRLRHRHIPNPNLFGFTLSAHQPSSQHGGSLISGGVLGFQKEQIPRAVFLMWLFGFSLLVGAQGGITHPAEVRALRAIRSTLIDTNKNLSNWNRGDPCTSNWTGVLCFNTSQDDGYLHVRELQLLNMNLSGSLSPELGRLSRLKILDFMWNEISGSIPKEIGNITSLELLLLNGNHLTGPLPEEIGYLPNLDRIQIDQNNISGSIPSSFANLNKTKHFHMNNNSISGQIPPELARLPYLVHFLLDNNNLSGHLPPELSRMPNLTILQLDNNNFEGTTIPDSYGDMSKLLKLSLRNCNLQGPIPDLSRIPQLGYLDLSSNRLNGTIPTNQLSQNITTIDLSNNELTGSIPSNFSGLPILQELSLANNSLNGSIQSSLWQSKNLNATESLIVDLENNMLTDISGSANLPPNVTLWLKGNPVCTNRNLSLLQPCASRTDRWLIPDSDIFGPYELLNFNLLDIYTDVPVTTSRSGISTGALIGIVLGGIAIAVTLSAVVTLLILRVRLRNYRVVSKRRQKVANGLNLKPISSKASIKIDGVKSFTYTELAMATNNFNSSTQVGQEGEQMLVYEFMPNGTLRDHLSAKSKEPMSFAMRLKIALGSAKGILYLHTEADPPIFHRDIKASNILLDSKFTAKVADFGLSRLAPVPDVEGAVPAHVSTVVKGTPGYLDPEYFLTHKLTDKSDVYSLGVVFLELLTGMQPISHGKNIVREVNVAYHSGMIFTVIDGKMGSYPSECVEKFVTLALKCCQDETDGRPSMADVVRELENIWVMMPESDMGVSESIDTIPEKMTLPSSSSSMVKNPYVSSDVSGSDLVSGVIPSITPR
ncbi:hypothetical protein V6N12_025797 [Hibiscus sabdariffa]|uniref:non-specific serine/threonine protein kinase n=1 Tax=Hibiscus sabdariffa TaxID=183260 RepID=A0ABR2DQV0_9ROSI